MKISIIEANQLYSSSIEKAIFAVNKTILVYKNATYQNCLDCKLSSMDLIIINYNQLQCTDFIEFIKKTDEIKLVPIIVYNLSSEFKPNILSYVYLSNIFNYVSEMDKLKYYVNIIYKKSAYLDPAHFIDFKIYRRKISINKSNIVYVETSINKIKLVSQFEVLEVAYFKLKDYKFIFGDDFIRCHRSYIVNPKFIHYMNLSENYIKLISNFGTIPIGNKYRLELNSIDDLIS